jgi:GDP-4-dehydro-6-deoxy-D-mannose reductase
VRTLITGISGFLGPHLAALSEPEAELYGLLWGELPDEERNLLTPRVHLMEGDVTRPESLRPILEAVRPELVFHLAAASSVARSWNHAARSLEINAIGTVHLLDGLLALGLRPTTVVLSSAEVYGPRTPDEGPIDEDAPLEPVSPYGTSKLAQDLLASQVGAAHGIPVLRLRPFHLSGPRRPAHFALSSFARQIACIERGVTEPRLKVGNLEAVRDITDVRDAARACWMAAAHGVPGAVYNLCSGRGVRIGETLQLLLKMTEAEIEIEIDRERLRASDIPWMVGDPGRLTATTGWTPTIPLEKTLSDLLGWWRRRP